MNKEYKDLESLAEKFFPGYENYEDIQFLFRLRMLVETALRECRPDNKIIGKCTRYEPDICMLCDEREARQGYNQCLSDYDQNVKKYLNK